MVERLSEGGLLAVVWVGLALGVIFASLRIFTRLTRMNRLLADDYIVLFALALLLANAIIHTLQAPHLYYMIENRDGPASLMKYHVLTYTYFQFAAILIFWSVLWSIKASFLALYYFLLEGLPRNRLAWYAIALFTFLTYAGCWMGSVFTCHPASAYFKYGQCMKPIDQYASKISISYSTAADIVTDLLVMALPMEILRKSKMGTRQKLGLGIVFCLAFIIIAMSIVRAVLVTGKTYTDPVALAVWSVVESSVSMVVGCLPPLKALLRSNVSTSNTYTSSGNPISSARWRKKRSLTTSAWEDGEIPLQSSSAYHTLGESHDSDTQIMAQDDMHMDERSQSPADGKPGNIMMVHEFSVVRSERRM